MPKLTEDEFRAIQEAFYPQFRQYEPEGMPIASFHQLVDETQGIPKEKLSLFVTSTDSNADQRITWNEFIGQVQKEDKVFIQALKARNKYLNKTIIALAPGRAAAYQRKLVKQHAEDGTDYNWGEQEVDEFVSAYDCSPPPIFIPVITIIELAVFVYYGVVLSLDDDPSNDVSARGGGVDFNGPLHYDPKRRNQGWRFLTYMLLHYGYMHIIGNFVIQLLLGILLEVIHKFWRVGIVYFLGVIAGSLASSMCDPYTMLVGASGGCYALMGAHFASILMNWGTMQKNWRNSIVNFLTSGVFQLLVMLVLITAELAPAIIARHTGEAKSRVSYAAHIGGFLGGILVGVPVLRNLEVLKWEKVCFVVCIILYIILMIVGIAFNVICADAGQCPAVLPFFNSE